MSLLENFKYLNPFAKKFDANARFDKKLQQQIDNNSAGMSDAELDLVNLGIAPPDTGASADVLQRYINFTQIFQDKKERISKYRSMVWYPEISEALDIVCDESIVQDSEGRIAHLNITKEIPKRITKAYLDEFDIFMEDVMHARDNLYDLFFKWLVEGELFIEWIADKSSKKLIGYKCLPAFTTFPMYNSSGRVDGFAQTVIKADTGETDVVPFSGNQISYIHWGKYGKDMLDIRGYLEPSVRTYNQLKNLEDSLIVYRLVRAPERRVWNIEVGRLPTQKAEQFIRKIIQKYKKQMTYDSKNGHVDSSRNVQSLSEDFWFAKRDGQGTSVDTIGGNMQLGELEDVKYFLTKMYKTLKLPKNRWDSSVGQTQYQSGKDMDREELKFSLFIERIQNRFKKLVKDGFMEHIKFKYGKKKAFAKYLSTNLFDVDFTPSNFFAEMKDMELLETRLNLLGTAISYATSPDEPENPLAREFVLRRIYKMSDEEYDENQKFLNPEKIENRELRKDELESDADAKGEGDDEGDEDQGSEEEPQGNEPEDNEKETEEENVDTGIPTNDIHISKRVKDFLQRPAPKRKKLL